MKILIPLTRVNNFLPWFLKHWITWAIEM